MKVAAAYIRVSTDEQLEYSPDAQKRAILEHAKRNGYIITEDLIFVDEGISGRRAEKRPAFMRMISMAKTKPRPFDAIFVHKFDRFARNREDSVVYKSLLRKECGVQVISITEPMEDDKFSVILEAMLEAMAEYYSLNLSEEVVKGMAERARRGGILAKAPYGYKNIDPSTPPVVIEKEAELVKFMFEKVATKEMTALKLARYFLAMGIKTRNNAPWHSTSIKQILRNSFYTGEIVWNREHKPTGTKRDKSEWIISRGLHKPIIDVETYNAVQAILQESKLRNIRVRNEVCHWLSGVLKCSSCGSSMTIVKSTKYPTFQCINYNKGFCKVSHSATKKAIENAVINALNAFLKEPELHTSYTKRLTVVNIDETSLLESKLKKANEKLKRVKSAFADGIDTLEEYKVNKQNISNEISTIEFELSKLIKPSNVHDLSKLKVGIKNVLDVVQSEGVDDVEKNKVLKSIVEKIVFNKYDKSIEVFYFLE